MNTSKPQISPGKLVLKILKNSLFPSYCVICGRIAVFTPFMCKDCFYELEIFLDSPVLSEPEEMSWIREVVCVYWFTPGLQSLIHHLKYKQAGYIGFWLGERTGILTLELPVSRTGCLIPVPLHRKRKRVRGYNQSEQIARGISKIWNIPVLSDLCYRRVHTSTQTRLNREERQKNISGIFDVKKGKPVPEKCVIVDDIFTTGATTFELARVLNSAGVNETDILTLGTPFTHECIQFQPDIDDIEEK